MLVVSPRPSPAKRRTARRRTSLHDAPSPGRLEEGRGGYGRGVSDDRTTPATDEPDDRDLRAAEEVLELFNAGEVIERPGTLDEPESPADESDVPAPG